MPTKRKRSSRATGLALYDRAALTVGTGANNWTNEERERLRQLWLAHGQRLVDEATRAGVSEPWGVHEFGMPV